MITNQEQLIIDEKEKQAEEFYLNQVEKYEVGGLYPQEIVKLFDYALNTNDKLRELIPNYNITVSALIKHEFLKRCKTYES